MIYRLITRGTIEERMMQMTKKRMVLDHLVMGRTKTRVFSQVLNDVVICVNDKQKTWDQIKQQQAASRHTGPPSLPPGFTTKDELYAQNSPSHRFCCAAEVRISDKIVGQVHRCSFRMSSLYLSSGCDF